MRLSSHPFRGIYLYAGGHKLYNARNRMGTAFSVRPATEPLRWLAQGFSLESCCLL